MEENIYDRNKKLLLLYEQCLQEIPGVHVFNWFSSIDWSQIGRYNQIYWFSLIGFSKQIKI